MKTETEIKKKLQQVQINKHNCKRNGFEQGYIVNCKLEKLFKWVLGKEGAK